MADFGFTEEISKGKAPGAWKDSFVFMDTYSRVHIFPASLVSLSRTDRGVFVFRTPHVDFVCTETKKSVFTEIMNGEREFNVMETSFPLENDNKRRTMFISEV